MAGRRERTVELEAVADRILKARQAAPARRSVLVAISGIDGSGKGYLSARIVALLRAHGARTVAIHVDGWLSLPHVRFDESDPAGHFYRHAIRFEELFSKLVLPLREQRSVRLIADHAEETSTEYRRHVYDFNDVDIIVLEGIYLLKRELVVHYDLSIWIECSIETALGRAIARRQEGLSREDTVRAYRRVYFPAQRLHLIRDDPENVATLILDNDPRNGRVGGHGNPAFERQGAESERPLSAGPRPSRNGAARRAQVSGDS